MQTKIGGWGSFAIFALSFMGTLAGAAVPSEFQYSYRDGSGRVRIVDARQFNEESSHHAVEAREVDQEEYKKLEALRDRSRSWATPAVVTWFQYQTPIRNQRDRNTCSIFGMVAAIEARYRRQLNTALDLSEQYAWHAYKSSTISHPKIYKYENQSSYWGGGGSHGVRELWNYAVPVETAAPYLDGSGMNALRLANPAAGALAWMPEPADNAVTQEQVDAFEYSPSYISTAARQAAKYGIESYVLLDSATTRNTARMEELIAAGNEIIVDAQLKWRLNAATGILEYAPSVDGGAHVFLVVGYDRTRSFFYVKNSWGESDYLKVHYDLFRNASYAGAIVTAVTPPDRAQLKGRFLGTWRMDHDGWKGRLIVRRTTAQANAPTRFGHYVDANGRRFAVNGMTTDGGRGVQFHIAGVEYNAVGEMTGQRFDVHPYSWDVSYASGATTAGDVPYGTFLTRHNFAAPYGKDFTRAKWLGRWNMNHDGWQGKLQINGFAFAAGAWHVSASYTDANGATKPVSGKLDVGREHVLRLAIQFAPTTSQPFVLHFHTWAEKLFSGYTQYAGARFGAHGTL